LVGVQGSVERNGGAAGCDYTQEHGDPAGMIVGQNNHPRTRLKSIRGQPGTDRLGHVPQLGIGAALDPIAALDFQGDVFRPALDALDKAIVESGHGFAGNIT